MSSLHCSTLCGNLEPVQTNPRAHGLHVHTSARPNVTTDSVDRLRDRPATDLPYGPRLCAVTCQDGKLDGIGVEAPRIHRAACERPVRTGRQNPITATAISSLPKCVCKA